MRKAFRIVIAAACVVLAVFAVVTWMEKSRTPEPALIEPGQSSTETAEPEEFRKRTVIDNEICQIILTDFDAHYSPGPAFRVLVQNRSEQELLVSANAYVNRYVCRPTWAEKQWSDDGLNSYLLGDFYLVAQSGERFDTWLYWKPDVLAESDVRSIDAVSFTFHVNEKEENRENFLWFLEKNPGFEAIDLNEVLPAAMCGKSGKYGYAELYPNVQGTDGFFVSAARRKSDD